MRKIPVILASVLLVGGLYVGAANVVEKFQSHAERIQQLEVFQQVSICAKNKGEYYKYDSSWDEPVKCVVTDKTKVLGQSGMGYSYYDSNTGKRVEIYSPQDNYASKTYKWKNGEWTYENNSTETLQ